MRVVVQRVIRAGVAVNENIIGEIGKGLLVYVGIEKGDSEREITYMADKILNLRIFSDDQNKMNLNIQETGGEVLSISQFTLTSHIKKGRRPDFTNAEEPAKAEKLYEQFNRILSQTIAVKKGKFGATMLVHSINDGPVTFILEKKLDL